MTGREILATFQGSLSKTMHMRTMCIVALTWRIATGGYVTLCNMQQLCNETINSHFPIRALCSTFRSDYMPERTITFVALYFSLIVEMCILQNVFCNYTTTFIPFGDTCLFTLQRRYRNCLARCILSTVHQSKLMDSIPKDLREAHVEMQKKTDEEAEMDREDCATFNQRQYHLLNL